MRALRECRVRTSSPATPAAVMDPSPPRGYAEPLHVPVARVHLRERSMITLAPGGLEHGIEGENDQSAAANQRPATGPENGRWRD